MKLNPKYFDVDFKSPKLEVSVKSELGIDSIDAMNVDTSVAMVTDPPETSSPTAAPGAKADGTSVRCLIFLYLFFCEVLAFTYKIHLT